MKTESEFPGITAIRLTAMVNAAQDLLQALSGEGANCESNLEHVARSERRLHRAIDVARGADLPLHRYLFRTADISVVKLAESIVGLVPEGLASEDEERLRLEYEKLLPLMLDPPSYETFVRRHVEYNIRNYP